MDRVGEMADVNDPDGDADERDDLRELLAELIQLLLQWGFLLLSCRHLVTDLTDFGGNTGGDDNADGPTRSDVCALLENMRTCIYEHIYT